MAAATDQTVHATVIAADGRAALIRGPSGAGKSDLALRCLALAPSSLVPHEARLVADDRVLLVAAGGRLLARAPAGIAGLIEVRGLGIVRLPALPEAELRLVVDLVAPGDAKAGIERLPPDPLPPVDIAGVALPLLRLVAFEASAPLKLMLALARV